MTKADKAQLDGATRLVPIIGDPIRYAQSPVRPIRRAATWCAMQTPLGMADGDSLPVDPTLMAEFFLTA